VRNVYRASGRAVQLDEFIARLGFSRTGWHVEESETLQVMPPECATNMTVQLEKFDLDLDDRHGVDVEVT
jgi:hypothetical protein